jgi:glycosyltransferase involved in cell wall biosynthesis
VGDYFIAVSKFIRDELLSNGCPEEKVLLHYIGVDTNYFAQDLNIHREETILYVGRLVEYKGCHDLIKAIYIVQKKVPNVKLVIIGDGKMRSYLEKCANDFKINCHFLGRQPKHIVRKWMNKAKVFCLPSFTTNDNKTEAFGMVFAEAQAMGLPVVSCRSGGIPEVVQHGITGFLTSERDHVELSYYISYLLSDSHKWQELSDNARVWVNKKFDIIKQTKILEDLYDEVILKHRLNTDTKQ